MKRLYFLLIFLLTCSATFAQQNVALRIRHKFGSYGFQTGVQVTNSLGQPFTVNRLQYYIGEVTLIHDGGQTTVIPDTWFLMDATQSLDTLLGSFPITSLEGIRFGIGVDSAHNHLDPSQYPTHHPLAPKSPSMQWGWSSGYIFVAMDGLSGTGLAQTYEIHSLEDVNYFHVTVMTTGTATGQGFVIDLDADYVEALYGIDVASGPINHGGTGSAVTLLENFRDRVFTEGVATSVASSGTGGQSFAMSPNPSDGRVNFSLESSLARGSRFLVMDALGRVLQTVAVEADGRASVAIASAGYYTVALHRNGQVLVTRRLVITK